MGGQDGGRYFPNRERRCGRPEYAQRLAEQSAAFEPRVGFLSPPCGYSADAIVRIKQLKNCLDMAHSFAKPTGFLFVGAYLSAEISVQSDQVRDGRVIRTSFESVWHWLTCLVSAQVVPSGIQSFRRLRHNTARANVLAADEAKPIEPLLVAEAKALIILIHFTPTAAAALSLPP
jgi:hypothetical protein